MKKFICCLLILAMVLTVVGCQSNNESAEEVSTNTPAETTEKTTETTSTETTVEVVDEPTLEGEGTLRVAGGSEVKTMNPHEYTSSYEKTVLQKLNARLYSFYIGEDKKSYDLTPDFAEGDPVQMDDAGKVWQIKVKKESKWANGEALTAEDFYYSWQMLLDPSLLAKRGATFAKNIDLLNGENYYYQIAKELDPVAWEDVGVKLIDSHTLELTCSSKQTVWDIKYHMDEVFSSAVYKPLFEAGMNADRTETTYGTVAEEFLSAGPFYLEKWIIDSESIYLKNPHYVHQGRIWLAGIHNSVVEDPGTRMQLFESGDIDYVSLSAEDYLKYEEDPRVLYEPTIKYSHICVNMISEENPILGNLNFRKALFFAMNREQLADFGKHTPANYVVVKRKIGDPSSGLKYRDSEPAKANVTENNGFDPDMAKELFEKALAEEGLDKVTINLAYYDSNETYKAMSEYLQQYLPELFGADKFELTLTSLPSKQLKSIRRGWKDDPNSSELTWATWSGSEFNPWYGMVVYTIDWFGKNEPFLSEEFDALYEEAMSGEGIKDDPMKRIELVAEMEKMLLDEVPFIPVYESVGKYLKNDTFALPGIEWVNGFGFGWHYGQFVD